MRRVSTIAAVLALALVSGATAAGPSLVTLATQRRAAVLDLYALQSRVDGAQRRLSALQQRAQTLHAQEHLLQQQFSATRTTLEVSQVRLAANLRDLYKRGNVSALAVVLGARSLDDAVTQLDTLRSVAEQSRRIVIVTSSAARRVTALRHAIAADRARAEAAVAAARSTLDVLKNAEQTRIAFIRRLQEQERAKRAQLDALERRVDSAEAKSQQLTARAAPAQPAVAGGTLAVTTTGYSLPGHTATGLPVGWGVAAVDPSVIPLGTKLTIPGYGEAVAADTGSSVRGRDVDLWFPTLAQARAWGRRTVTVVLH